MGRRAMAGSVSAVLLGLVGAVLRILEVQIVIDPVTGLAEPMHPISILLVGLSLITAILFFLQTTPLKGLRLPASADTLGGGPVLSCLRMAAAAAVLLGAVLGFADAPDLLFQLFQIMSLVAAAALFLSAFALWKGRSSGVVSAVMLLPVFFWLLRLVVTYRLCSADPTLQNYMYHMLALCSSLLAFFCAAGFLLERPLPRKTVWLCYLAVYFSLVAGAGSANWSWRCLDLGAALCLLSYGHGVACAAPLPKETKA